MSGQKDAVNSAGDNDSPFPLCGDCVGVWEVDTGTCTLHDDFNVGTTSSNHKEVMLGSYL